jgi:hypothetical protein
MVRDELFQGTKPSDDVVKKELSCSNHDMIECQNGFLPFSEVIGGHNNALMVIDISRFVLHKINGPFAELVCGDNGMQWSRQSSCLG